MPQVPCHVVHDCSSNRAKICPHSSPLQCARVVEMHKIPRGDRVWCQKCLIPQNANPSKSLSFPCSLRPLCQPSSAGMEVSLQTIMDLDLVSIGWCTSMSQASLPGGGSSSTLRRLRDIYGKEEGPDFNRQDFNWPMVSFWLPKSL